MIMINGLAYPSNCKKKYQSVHWPTVEFFMVISPDQQIYMHMQSDPITVLPTAVAHCFIVFHQRSNTLLHNVLENSNKTSLLILILSTRHFHPFIKEIIHHGFFLSIVGNDTSSYFCFGSGKVKHEKRQTVLHRIWSHQSSLL
jgi:hypothetical protein